MWFHRGDWVHGKPRPDRWCVDDANQKQMGGEARRAQSRRVFLRVEDGGAGPGSYGSSLHTRDTQAFSEVTPWECGAEATPSHDKTAKVALRILHRVSVQGIKYCPFCRCLSEPLRFHFFNQTEKFVSVNVLNVWKGRFTVVCSPLWAVKCCC